MKAVIVFQKACINTLFNNKLIGKIFESVIWEGIALHYLNIKERL